MSGQANDDNEMVLKVRGNVDIQRVVQLLSLAKAGRFQFQFVGVRENIKSPSLGGAAIFEDNPGSSLHKHK